MPAWSTKPKVSEKVGLMDASCVSRFYIYEIFNLFPGLANTPAVQNGAFNYHFTNITTSLLSFTRKHNNEKV